jgi:ABC-type polysaccharide/polyol phosphate transport system ATPase subunit
MTSSGLRIRFEDVVQRFRVIQERPDTLREVFARLTRARSRSYAYEALRGISFDIWDGDLVGIIGRNGSGKSTILKLIAGVYKPSAGQLTVNGRVAALIELGAGFHPELTGRENILINGLLLGMSRREVKEREQRIIDFAELGEFIDVPVKQYSSGMFMRLGFAVAAEVDPDILLLDEILAVGDAGFQRKCLERMEAFRKQRKTIVLVTHDMTAVREMCSRAILLQDGQIAAEGSPEAITSRYEADVGQLVTSSSVIESRR